MAKAKTTTKKRKYELIGGPHVAVEEGKRKRYTKGDTIVSDVNLVKKFPSKFRLVR